MQPMKYDVFISCSSHDSKVAEDVCAYLEKCGISCFMAGRDIPAGKGRARAVVDAVGVSRMVVVIYSADFNASEQAGIEVELASEDGKPVLVFRIADEDFPAPKGGYMQNLCIDAFPDPARKFSALGDKVKELLGTVDAAAATTVAAASDSGSAASTVFPRVSSAAATVAAGATVAASAGAVGAAGSTGDDDDDIVVDFLELDEPEDTGEGKDEPYRGGMMSDGAGITSADGGQACDGPSDAAGQYNLGHSYYHGDGRPKDYKMAAYWYGKAAEQGDMWAQKNLGICYEHGEGVEKDPARAVYWYSKAAEQGDAWSQTELGICYENGNGVEKDPAKAAYWYGKAALQGHAWAQCNLASCYEYGFGVEQDMVQAAYWYGKAADQNFARAQFNLGVSYENGTGVEKDMSRALSLYRKAAGQGYDPAQKRLAKLGESW